MSGMKMAKASEADIEAACSIAHILNCIADGEMPDADDLDYFDIDDAGQCRGIVAKLIGVVEKRPGAMNRVVWGMAVLLGPANKIVDPHATTLERYPGDAETGPLELNGEQS